LAVSVLIIAPRAFRAATERRPWKVLGYGVAAFILAVAVGYATFFVLYAILLQLVRMH
jgi:hypothetical protein